MTNKTPAQIAAFKAPISLLTFPFPNAPTPGSLRLVAPGVYWLRMPLPFALDHINLWLLKDGDGWTIVDCGYGNSATKELWEQIFTDYLEDRPVYRVIVTHFHPDHIGLAAWLTKRLSAELWMSQAEFLAAHAVCHETSGYTEDQFVELYRRHGIEESQLQSIALRNSVYRAGVPSLPKKYRRIMNGDEITIDGQDWRIVMGYGHAPEHAALYCESLELLISGDMVLPSISTNVSVTAVEPDGNPLKLFLRSIARYGQLLPNTLVLPSHGRVFRGLPIRTEQLQQHHEKRFEEIYDATAEPRTAFELLPVMFRRLLDEHQISFAMGEMIAHLNYLHQAGRLQRALGTDGVYRFVRITN